MVPARRCRRGCPRSQTHRAVLRPSRRTERRRLTASRGLASVDFEALIRAAMHARLDEVTLPTFETVDRIRSHSRDARGHRKNHGPVSWRARVYSDAFAATVVSQPRRAVAGCAAVRYQTTPCSPPRRRRRVSCLLLLGRSPSGSSGEFERCLAGGARGVKIKTPHEVRQTWRESLEISGVACQLRQEARHDRRAHHVVARFARL